MLDSLNHAVHLAPLAGIPSPPGWQHYVHFLEVVLNDLSKLVHNAGLGIILFTIIIKTILLPLTIKSTRSSRAMQELQPKIKELQKKYGGDRAKVQAETMKLYSQYKVNPMSGCLPMLVQMPIFFGVYRAVLHLSEGKSTVDASVYWEQSFLWMHSFTNAAGMTVGGLARPDPYHILPILAGVLQFVQAKMVKPAGQGKSSDPQQAMMNSLMNFMPLTVVLFGWNFAAGPVLYWVTQSGYSVIQQWLITGWGSMKDWFPWLPEMPEEKRLGYAPPRNLDEVVVVTDENGVPVKPKGFSAWWQTKMQEAQNLQTQKESAKGAAPSATTGVSATAEPVDAEVVQPKSGRVKTTTTKPPASSGSSNVTTGAKVNTSSSGSSKKK